MNVPSRVLLTWDDICLDIRKAVLPWAAELKPTLIIAVSRGGMMPAAVLAQMLGIHKIDVVGVEGYGPDNKPLESLNVYKHPSAICYREAETALIIDDICDSGRTMQKLARMLPKAKRCAIYGKLPAADRDCHHVGRMVPANCWVDFPWEHA